MSTTARIYAPELDPAICGGEADCVDMCEHNVFEVPEGAIEPIVARPDLCVDGCTLCVQICMMGAIKLPEA